MTAPQAAPRIWYQSMIPLDAHGAYLDALTRHAAEVCTPGVEVIVHGVSPMSYGNRTPADLLRYPYAKHVVQQEVIDYARRAEAEGFDGMILGSFSEPFLTEVRSLVRIPVVSMPEATLLTSCSLAEQFALVTLGASNVIRLRRVIRRHGLESRVAGIFPFPTQTDEAELNAAFTAPEVLVERFTSVAQEAVKAGADVVIPAEGVLNELLRFNDVTSIDGATVMDCVGTSLLYAEFLIAMRRRLDLGVGRRWSYLTPPPDLKVHLDHYVRERASSHSIKQEQ